MVSRFTVPQRGEEFYECGVRLSNDVFGQQHFEPHPKRGSEKSHANVGQLRWVAEQDDVFASKRLGAAVIARRVVAKILHFLEQFLSHHVAFIDDDNVSSPQFRFAQ